MFCMPPFLDDRIWTFGWNLLEIGRKYSGKTEKTVYNGCALCYNHNNDFKLYHFKEAKYHGTHR